MLALFSFVRHGDYILCRDCTVKGETMLIQFLTKPLQSYTDICYSLIVPNNEQASSSLFLWYKSKDMYGHTFNFIFVIFFNGCIQSSFLFRLNSYTYIGKQIEIQPKKIGWVMMKLSIGFFPCDDNLISTVCYFYYGCSQMAPSTTQG